MRIKREAGENPARSRHCDRELKAIMSLGILSREGVGGCELKSGELLNPDRLFHTVHVRSSGLRISAEGTVTVPDFGVFDFCMVSPAEVF